MTFTYPAVFTPHKDDKGFHAEFPDLELCEADGPDLEDAIEAARDAAYNWLSLEWEISRSRPTLRTWSWRKGRLCGRLWCGSSCCRTMTEWLPGLKLILVKC